MKKIKIFAIIASAAIKKKRKKNTVDTKQVIVMHAIHFKRNAMEKVSANHTYSEVTGPSSCLESLIFPASNPVIHKASELSTPGHLVWL